MSFTYESGSQQVKLNHLCRISFKTIAQFWKHAGPFFAASVCEVCPSIGARRSFNVTSARGTQLV